MEIAIDRQSKAIIVGLKGCRDAAKAPTFDTQLADLLQRTHASDFMLRNLNGWRT